MITVTINGITFDISVQEATNLQQHLQSELNKQYYTEYEKTNESE